MQSFLAEVAATLLAEHPNDLDRVTVVFNNRRSGLFLRQHLLSQGPADRPFFLPRTVGMDNLVQELGGLQVVDNQRLLFELYDIHCQLPDPGRRFETFEEFLSLGEMMLSDFSEVDLYCADAQQLFANLHDLKAIGEWDIEDGHLTPFQERYLHFYRSLYQYYDQLRQRLLPRGQAYAGMAYRHVAEHIDELAHAVEEMPYYFVGFNAFSTSEQRIIRHCLSVGTGRLISDGDAYYFDDPQQEAGYFLRQQSGLFAGVGPFAEHFAQEAKEITIVSCPEKVMQCKYAGQLLSQLLDGSSDESLHQTALVLADESLLLPTLNSLPAEVRSANVTMGFPYVSTSVHALVLKLFSLHQRRRGVTFYHHDLRDLLCDRCISQLLGGSLSQSKLVKLLQQEHIIYADLDTLHALLGQAGVDMEPIDFLFAEGQPNADTMLALLRQLVRTLYVERLFDTNAKEQEALGCLLQLVDYLQEIQSQYHFVDSLDLLLRLYTRLAQRQSVPFYGEPLDGLQILGVLEARNLDFDQVILLSTNEGVLPTGHRENSLIPYNLKMAFGLPTFRQKDAVYAYNFYRLLQRAKRVYLLYHTESEGVGKGEASRFVLQLRRELAMRYPGTLTLREEVLAVPNVAPPPTEYLPGQKSVPVMERLRQMAERGLSPSALNKYRACPQKFYLENVLGIQPIDPLNEDLEQNQLGTCIHAALQAIYSMDADGHVRPDTLRQALEQLDEIVDKGMDSQFSHGRSREGRNHFYREVAKQQVSSFVRAEIERIEKGGHLRVIGLEQPLQYSLTVPCGGEELTVNIRGIADRIDEWNGIVRVIDYKSGRVEDRELRVHEADPHWADVSDKWFQLMAYEWLYHYSSPHPSPSQALPHQSGIFALSRLGSPLLTAEWEGSEVISPQHLARFEAMLQALLAELFQPDVPFAPQPGCRLCKYCPFDCVQKKIHY